MKNIILLLFVVSLISACNGSKKTNEAEQPAITVLPIELPDDILEVRGVVGDGTSMNVLELVLPDSDTLYINSPDQMTLGGQLVGQEVDVIYNVMDGDKYAQVVINVTALQHLWCQKGLDGHRQGIELDSNGTAVTYDMTVDYDRWMLEDGLLLLFSPKKVGEEKSAVVDTFQILMLSEDSLVLLSPRLMLETQFYREN